MAPQGLTLQHGFQQTCSAVRDLIPVEIPLHLCQLLASSLLPLRSSVNSAVASYSLCSHSMARVCAYLQTQLLCDVRCVIGK